MFFGLTCSAQAHNSSHYFKKVIVDLRRVLEEAKRPAKKEAPEHIFLVLDKHTQAFPWESLPCFINMSMSRVPSASFLRHMAAFRETDFECRPSSDSVHVSDSTCLNSSSAYFLLNPSGDLVKTQETFQGWLEGHKTWTGLVGRRPMELELKNQLSENDLFMSVIPCIARYHFANDNFHLVTLVMEERNSTSVHRL